jgi:hypothetical protein
MNSRSHATSHENRLTADPGLINTGAAVIGTKLVENLTQAVALSHLVKGHKRVSLLLLAAPESGKTTIATAARCDHICQVAVISARSILKELRDNKKTEFLLFNDLSAVRAMSTPAVNLLVVMLNQLTQDERGLVAFAGKAAEHITREVGVIGCMPFDTFTDHRARWKELGFISRMVPFAYSYPQTLIATIKNGIDGGAGKTNAAPLRKMPRANRTPRLVQIDPAFTRRVRHLADNRAANLNQLGIRLLQNYHCLIRAHALLHKREKVTQDDLEFLRAVDHHVSITTCRPLDPL